jgi:hypothetical protein
MGCFAGTAANKFQDRQVLCPASSGYGGMCGANQQACLGGNVVPAQACSGNGIIRKREYRDEYYCAYVFVR